MSTTFQTEHIACHRVAESNRRTGRPPPQVVHGGGFPVCLTFQ